MTRPYLFRPAVGAAPAGVGAAGNADTTAPLIMRSVPRGELVSTVPLVTKSTTSTGNSTDRKSTRLNSSHTVISYAVFCLKKKMGGRHRRLLPGPAHRRSRAVPGGPERDAGGDRPHARAAGPRPPGCRAVRGLPRRRRAAR